MLNNANLRDPVLINTIGHTAGLLLFGLIIVLLIRDWHGNGIRQARLSLMAAALAFSWNMGSLFVLASHDSTSLLIGIVMAGNFAVLSLLPAVLLQVVLKGRQRAIVAAG
jgi:two-component system, LytTR family, sensor kinase